jgi:dGTP triphosphohydrolase
MKNLKIILLLLLVFQLSGCIIFHSVSYEVNFNEDGTGTALITIEDINTDAATKELIDEDMKSILDYGLKSQEFVKKMEDEGKKIKSRNVMVEREKLNAIVRYEFSDISKVEGMQFDDPYYYLTDPVEDSIISTNGQITRTKDYQRIVWDKSIKTLKFKMYSDDTSKDGLKSLAPYYLKEN